MTSLDDLDLMDAQTPATPNVSTKRCRRHQWHTVTVIRNREAVPGPNICLACGKVRDEATVRRNRNNARRGKTIQRKRIVGLGGQNLPGNKPNHDGIGLLFSYESKSGGAFSERYWRWLTGIPVTADQTAVLVVTSTDGPGRKARSYVVVEYDQWRDLHGESER